MGEGDKYFTVTYCWGDVLKCGKIGFEPITNKSQEINLNYYNKFALMGADLSRYLGSTGHMLDRY